MYVIIFAQCKKKKLLSLLSVKKHGLLMHSILRLVHSNVLMHATYSIRILDQVYLWWSSALPFVYSSSNVPWHKPCFLIYVNLLSETLNLSYGNMMQFAMCMKACFLTLLRHMTVAFNLRKENAYSSNALWRMWRNTRTVKLNVGAKGKAGFKNVLWNSQLSNTTKIKRMEVISM